MSNALSNDIVSRIDKIVAARHLLTHPFYQAWTNGTLSQDSLELYAKQYFKHVDAFPGYIQNLLDRDVGSARPLLLENLAEELNPEAPHPELWKDFAEAVGVTRKAVDDEKPLPEIKKLVEVFSNISTEKSVAAAIAILYAYESQIPEVAAEKIRGLKAHFGLRSRKGLGYFEVHMEADKEHREVWKSWLSQQTDLDEDEILSSVEKAMAALWGALDSCHLEAKTIH